MIALHIKNKRQRRKQLQDLDLELEKWKFLERNLVLRELNIDPKNYKKINIEFGIMNSNVNGLTSLEEFDPFQNCIFTLYILNTKKEVLWQKTTSDFKEYIRFKMKDINQIIAEKNELKGEQNEK